MKKLISIILALALCLGLYGCKKAESGSANSTQTIPDGSTIIKGAEFHYTLDEGCKETFHLQFFVTDAYDPNMGSAGIYMRDMDSGILYDESFLNWNVMSQGDSWNLDTRETALMVFLNTYFCNMDADILWSDQATFTHYSEQELAQMSAQLSSNGGSVSVTEESPITPTEEESAPHNEATMLTMDAEFIYEQAKQMGIQLKQVHRYYIELDEGPIMNLLFFQSTEFDNCEIVSFSAPGLYMLDMDTGIWYDSSFLDWDRMTVNNIWDLSNHDTALMCTFTFYDQIRNTGTLYSDKEQRMDLDAATLETINQKLLIDQLTRTVPAYPYSSVEEEPRQLSDEEISALLYRPATYVKSVISTVPDAIAFLDQRFPELWMGMSYNNGNEVNDRWLRSAVEILSDHEADAARSCAANCVSYLLDDNYQVESLIAFWPDPDIMNSDGPEKAINVIKTADGYLFFDAALRMQSDAESRKNLVLPEMKCASVAEYVEHIRQDPVLSSVIKYIFKNTGGVRMNYTRSFTNGYTITTASEGIEQVYYSITPQDPGQKVSPENISSYKLSTMLGGVTLTAEEAYALVDAAPEVVQEKVKTAADVLMYMLAAKIGDSMGCKCTPVDGHTWHWNMSAKEVMYNKLGNCGSCANLANYLLDGDYEEVGYMDQAYYPGSGGSHVYTYILHQGKYYILDYSWYIFNQYEPSMDFAVPVLDSLEQWPQKIQRIYGPVCLVMTYDTPGMQYPVIFGDEYEQEFGGIYYILPENTEYTVLYEAPDGYQYHHIPFDTSAYDWNNFGVN